MESVQRNPMRANIRQVAERAGVSRTTVSNVLLGRHDIVAADKCEMVLEAARALDYVPVRPTLQNRHMETRVIAVPLNEPRKFGWCINSGTYEGLCEAAVNHGYDVLMLLRPDSGWAAQHSQIQLLDRRSDGIVFASPIIGESRATFETLLKHHIPTVVCYRRDVPEGISWVDPDNKSAMFQAVGHLVEQGHTKIAHLTENKERGFDNLARRRYFSEAMTYFGLDSYAHCIVASPDFEVGTATLHQIRQSGATAVACYNDLLALKLWAQATQAGLRVPDDLSLVGIDGVDAKEHSLTSVEFSFAEVGREAVKGLVRQMQGKSAEKCCSVIPVQLHARQSVKKLSRSRHSERV